MIVRLYRNDMETLGKNVEHESDVCKPFIEQCNISDIFPDVTVKLTYQGEMVEFLLYISLRDGSVQIANDAVFIKYCAGVWL